MAADWDALSRRLWQEVVRAEGRIGADTRAFIARLIERLKAEGWQLGPEAQAELTRYFERMDQSIRDGIRAAVGPVAEATLAGSLAQRQLIEDALAQAYARRWPDGLKLSDRVWRWQDETRRGVERVLAENVRAGQAVSRAIYDMQRAIEAGGARFEIVTQDIEDWVSTLRDAARAVIHDPKAYRAWAKTVMEAEGHLETLAETGTYYAGRTAIDAIKAAVQAGAGELADDALSWWVYDRQLYDLKRIARTEMSTAYHNAVIDATQGDADIIGYQWRLSGSHPEAADICDWFAGVEMGLGKGVWPKDQVPREKAHPHCMCSLLPRVSKIQQLGSHTYAEFVDNLPPGRRTELLPKWAQEAVGQGVALPDLIRPDGLGIITRVQATDRGLLGSSQTPI